MNYFSSFLISLILAMVLTPVVRDLALRYGKIALPVRDRWHQKPTALLGGIAIFIAFWISTWLMNPYDKLLFLIFPASFLLFLFGLLDDFLDIKPASKLVGQIIVACLMVFSGLLFHLHLLISVPISILWYVGLMNAFNLLDNMDGLASGIACIASLMLGLYALFAGQPEITMAALALTGATLGFLVYNTHPASIFMGDCGSLFLGHLLAALALLGTNRSPSSLIMTLLVPVLLLSVPIFDTVFVTLTRFFHSRPISQGGKDHTSHRLVAFGVSQKKAVWILYGISLVSGSVVLLSATFTGTTVLALAVLLTITLILFGMFLGEVKIQIDNPSGSQDFTNKKGFILDILFQHKRRFGEVLVDLTLVCLSYYSAFFLKYDGIIPPQAQHLMKQSLPIVIVCQLVNFFLFGLYRGVWKYVGIRDAIAIVKAVTVGTVLSIFLFESFFRFEYYSRAVLLIFLLVLLTLVSGSRIAMRLFFEFLSSSIQKQKKAVIIGAGDMGELFLRVLQGSHHHQYEPIAFIDNDPKRIGKTIHGIPVVGNHHALRELIEKHKIDTAFITISSTNPEQLQLKEIEQACKLHNIECRLVGTILENTPA